MLREVTIKGGGGVKAVLHFLFVHVHGARKDDMGGVAGGEESPTLRLLL